MICSKIETIPKVGIGRSLNARWKTSLQIEIDGDYLRKITSLASLTHSGGSLCSERSAEWNRIRKNEVNRVAGRTQQSTWRWDYSEWTVLCRVHLEMQLFIGTTVPLRLVCVYHRCSDRELAKWKRKKLRWENIENLIDCDWNHWETAIDRDRRDTDGWLTENCQGFELP